MQEHKFLLVIFLIGAVLVGSLFIFIYRSSITHEGGTKNPLKKRFFLFLILGSVIIVLLTVTIPKSPYFLFADNIPAKVVYVVARQFDFVMSNQVLDPENLKGSEPIELPVGEIVEFRITSSDVNHGFGIYDEHTELVAQTQAMPGYVNRLRWKFTEPGTYNVLCLEFCGFAHQLMRTSFTVK